MASISCRSPSAEGGGRIAGPNLLRVRPLLPKVFLRSDDDLLSQVKNAIRADELGLSVTVADGLVTLSGVFPEPSQPDTALRPAREVDGVVAVRHSLT
ncbi:BON domain-containing protein [Nonomuraea fuscirosea]|uniref:BON domain-containing protein n=1 Tax=Nonomuraea fuscirosea TaxID=1291556 RepID=UPI0033E01D53